MTSAAILALLGLPALTYLTTEDPVERLVLAAVAERAQEIHDLNQRNLAVHVVNTLGKALRHG